MTRVTFDLPITIATDSCQQNCELLSFDRSGAALIFLAGRSHAGEEEGEGQGEGEGKSQGHREGEGEEGKVS